MILFIKHIAIEGPGAFGDFSSDSQYKARTIELDNGGTLPEDLRDIQAIVILGGPMNVYEEEKYPFLKHEDTFLKKAIKKEIPILGICLGAQLIAKACGAVVKKAQQEEIGWFLVDLTEEALKDPLFTGLSEKIYVFQWHGDTFEIPDNATLLATSKTCKNQAFKCGNAYGLQFHVEVTDKEIKAWPEEYFDKSDLKLQVKSADMLENYQKKQKDFKAQAFTIYKNFTDLINKTPTAEGSIK